MLSDSGTSAIAPSFPGFSYMFANGNNIKVILNALSTVTHVEVVSSPEVMVLNNQTATLQVGDRVPIVTAAGRQHHDHRRAASSTASSTRTPA